MTFTILVACSANVCRSPLVAATLLHAIALEEVGLRVSVTTGGLDVVPGEPPCPEMLEAAGSRGLRSRDLAQHRSTALTADQIEAADLVLAVDRRVRSGIVKRVPRVGARAFTVREAALLGDRAATQVEGRSVEERLRSYAAAMNASRGLTDLPRTRHVVALSAPWRRMLVHAHDIPDAHQDERAPHRFVHHRAVSATMQLAGGLSACAPVRAR